MKPEQLSAIAAKACVRAGVRFVAVVPHELAHIILYKADDDYGVVAVRLSRVQSDELWVDEIRDQIRDKVVYGPR